jgi:hypothetical protein
MKRVDRLPGSPGALLRLNPLTSVALSASAAALGAAMLAPPSTAPSAALMATSGQLPTEITLAHDAGASALFRAANLAPGTTLTNCVKIQYRSPGLERRVDLHAEVTGDGAGFLGMAIDVGHGGGYGNCAGFTADSPAYDGTLAGFADAHPDVESALTLRRVADIDELTVRFRFSVSTDNAAQGTTADAGFVWTAVEDGPSTVEEPASPLPSGPPTIPTVPTPAAPSRTPTAPTPVTTRPDHGNGGGPAAGPDKPPAEPKDFWHSAGDAIAEAAAVVLAKVVVPVARAGTVGVGMYLLVFVFLAVQNRIDRRDPKLALAPTKRRTDPVFRQRSEVSA